MDNIVALSVKEWQKLEYGMFIHFGMSTFTGRIPAYHQERLTDLRKRIDASQTNASDQMKTMTQPTNAPYSSPAAGSKR
ncbi:MAG: hypothetical protein WCH07_03300 [Deltaproteobacteria bacterium]